MSRKKLIIGAVLGGLLTVAPLCGLLATVVGLVGSFGDFANVAPEAKQQVLADGISGAMLPTFIGLAIMPVGLITLIYCVIKLRTSKPPVGTA